LAKIYDNESKVLTPKHYTSATIVFDIMSFFIYIQNESGDIMSNTTNT